MLDVSVGIVTFSSSIRSSSYNVVVDVFVFVASKQQHRLGGGGRKRLPNSGSNSTRPPTLSRVFLYQKQAGNVIRCYCVGSSGMDCRWLAVTTMRRRAAVC